MLVSPRLPDCHRDRWTIDVPLGRQRAFVWRWRGVLDLSVISDAPPGIEENLLVLVTGDAFFLRMVASLV